MIRIVSLNLNFEASHMFLEQLDFLQVQKADVICLQEVYEKDIKFLQKQLGMRVVFAPNRIKNYHSCRKDKKTGVVGVAILTNRPVIRKRIEYYKGSKNEVCEFIPEKTSESKVCRTLLVIEVDAIDGQKYTVGNTHFTWSPSGIVTNEQKKDFRSLLKVLKREKSIVLCGDFNTPRGKEIFTSLSRTYKDNIPMRYNTSIDSKRHYAGKLDGIMIDGLFSTEDYIVLDVVLKEGFSDHLAVLASVSKQWKISGKELQGKGKIGEGIINCLSKEEQIICRIDKQYSFNDPDRIRPGGLNADIHDLSLLEVDL